MPGLLEDCQRLFDTTRLYDILKVSEKATDEQIKKAYRKTALLVHPDKVPSNKRQEATEKFQAIGKVYSILSNKETRAIYDESGEVDDEQDFSGKEYDLISFWRQLFRKVTIEDIEAFEKEYKGSADEENDLKAAYEGSEGDMGKILELVCCSTPDDEDRFADIIRKWIKNGDVKDYPKFSQEPKANKDARKKKYRKEAKEAEKELEKLKNKEDFGDLESAIMKRQESRRDGFNSMLDNLAAKYGDKNYNPDDTSDSEYAEPISIRKRPRNQSNGKKKEEAAPVTAAVKRKRSKAAILDKNSSDDEEEAEKSTKARKAPSRKSSKTSVSSKGRRSRK